MAQENGNKPLKIAFFSGITLQNERQDRHSSWRITNGYIVRALQKYCGEVVQVGPINLKNRDLLLGKILNRISQLTLRKRVLYYSSFYFSRQYAEIAAQKLSEISPDVIVASSSATEIALLQTNIPIILIEGGTFALRLKYYLKYSKLLKRSVYETDTLYKLAFKRASLILHPSKWALDSTIQDYHVSHHKVHALPFGANIDKPPSPEIVQAKKKSDKCKLLFVGTEWHRKGGEIAFDTLLKLEELGIRAELIVCGCIPPKKFSHPRMTVIPFLNKSDDRQYEEMENLFLTSDFFLLPTRQEAFGIVFSEASAFGLPVITTNTGGIPGAVKDGENGFLLPYYACGTEYAELIAKLYKDDHRYAEMVKSSRATFEERLNWDSWAINVNKLVIEMLENKKGALVN